ncbi:MAG: diguanylate cyclase [Rhodocyclaceae bacterium]|nr:diguanylate cyclase [Rhodocyclaceae bacterium]
MAEFSQPSEIAREALRRLALRRIPPTPDNYKALYHEIAGTPAAEAFPERHLKAIAAALPRATPDQLRLARQLEQAAGEQSWDQLRAAIAEAARQAGSEAPAWGPLLKEFLAQYERPVAGMTAAKKRESLEHVLAASGNADILFGRLQSLVRSWAQGEAARAPGAEGEAAPIAGGPPSTAELRELLALLLENSLATLLAESPDLAAEATRLAGEVRAARAPEQFAGLTGKLKKFSYRLQFVAEDQAELRAALLRVLQLVVENIDELVLDDQWLHGQIQVVTDLIGQPLNLRRLDDVERRLKEVIVKQGSLKQQLNEARDRLKNMLASFVDRLARFSESTSGYHDKIERCAQRISAARDITELSDVLDEVMRETRTMQLDAQRSRDDMAEMRRRANDAEQEIVRLQNELSQASEMVRHDPLTGALNRKGMEEAMEKEVARVRRRGTPLCMALLDIDNFKKLNDSLGHDAGDKALVHLAQVVRETIRPQDSLARYGGEEFVVVLPDTGLDDAVKAMVRVQRELTKRFFLHGNDKVLITFSCGVAELMDTEPPPEALKRADGAMYLAKRQGKNRVLPA